jgi:hypothetical protein
MKVSIEEQIAAVEREVMNLAGHIEILRDLIKKKKRDPIVLGMKESLLPQLQAALETLRWVKKNQEKFR